jgi:hypothetical protein
MRYVKLWRDRAERMLKLAATVRDKRLSDWLKLRASEYLDQAAAREATKRAPETAQQSDTAVPTAAAGQSGRS